MNQDGMPMRFQAYIKSENRIFEVTNISCRDKTVAIKKLNEPGELPISSLKYRSIKYLFEEVILLQAIGATSSDDPPQELYLGDLGEVKWGDKTLVGEIFWHKRMMQVGVKLSHSHLEVGIIPNWVSFYVIDGFKKLGSRYTHPEILSKILSEGEGKKAGLEKP